MSLRRRANWIGRSAIWAVGFGMALGFGPARAESPSEAEADAPREEALRVPPSPGAGSAGGREGSPALESLLQLPPGFGSGGEQPVVAGASEAEWRRRFRRTHGELEDARAQLEATKQELDALAEEGGANQWAVAPPIGGATPQGNSPLSFKLRQQLKRDRERVDTAEKAVRELRIEADLAGVPPAWQSAGAPEGVAAQRELPVPP